MAGTILDRYPDPEFTRGAFDHLGDYSASTFSLAKPDGVNEEAVWLTLSNKGPHQEQRVEWASSKRKEQEKIGLSQPPKQAAEKDVTGIYRPIQDQYGIRVLEIYPGQRKDKIKASLHHCTVEFTYKPISMVPSGGGPYFTLRTKHALSTDNLEKPVFYTALSYTWGSGGFDCAIECDGGSLPITTSLDTALRHFRQKDHSVVMWIDQICINQKDGEEKKQQIPLMSKIYSRALNTAVWLGEGIDRRGTSKETSMTENGEEEPEDGIVMAFDLLRQIRVNLQFNEDSIGPKDLRRLLLPDEHAEAWKMLQALFSRPWFQRLWVIQEAILSETPWVVCGTRHWTNTPMLTAMPFDEFTNACSTLHRSGIGKLAALGNDGGDGSSDSNGDRLASGSGMVLNLSYQRESFWQAQSDLDLRETLIFTRYAQCYFAHDKIYGLLGVCGQRGIEIDYDRPSAELYRDVAVMFLTDAVRGLEEVKKHPYSTDLRVSRRDIFDVLICVDHEPAETAGTDKKASSPSSSWVPDWQRPRVTDSLGHSTSTLALYQAGGNLDPQLHISADRRTLTLRGKIVDVVDELSPAFVAAPHFGLPPSTTQANDLLTCLDMARRRYPCLGGKPCACSPRCAYASSGKSAPGTIFDAFWQTLVAGKDESGKQACPASWSLVFSLLLDAATGAPYALPDQTYDRRQLLPDGHPGKVTVAHLGSWGSEGAQQKQEKQPEPSTNADPNANSKPPSTSNKKKPNKRGGGGGGATDFNNRKLARSFHDVQTAAQHAMRNRHFGVTGEKRRFGLFPHHARAGDVVVVFAGCHVPFVLRRRREGTGMCQVVGECYVHGIMRGEVPAEDGEKGLEEIVLV
ncbi:heterokaryon incompatibility protein-domain-containing protein [Phyllosticta citribraziliensis]|uniref:Heterokaryon incompatibility protein-domain-containing protein n=1 Tax=Phyllosticta citribraziliensis TaxID=989973 RepID=A0ABR1LF60_9PEZI